MSEVHNQQFKIFGSSQNIEIFMLRYVLRYGQVYYYMFNVSNE